MSSLEQVGEIDFPAHLHRQVVEHARRKLRGEYLPGEEAEPKAYGLVGGRLRGSRIDVTHIFPLRRNLRAAPRYKPYIDRLMQEVGVPSETPFEKRGWVADPREVLRAERECEAWGSVVFGGYHMHRVAWEHDPRRDTCTALDIRLAEDSGLWALILSMVDPDRPVLRAFFEGHNHHEATIRIVAPHLFFETGKSPA
ncbi:MAG: hypothetical protein M3O70_13225 [Actinomycetota bacterium]|nr:hypothetical protein [Actinomycetota bacterium]